MAATERTRGRWRTWLTRPRRPEPDATRLALTCAALALPGLAAGVEGDEASVGYSHYEEGGRVQWPGPAGTVRPFVPLRVESVHGSGGLRLTDRLKLAFALLQDTWSGATPVLSAPEGFMTVTGASAYPVADGRTNRAALVPYGLVGSQRVAQPKLVHMMTAASAETRRQADATFEYEGSEHRLGVGGGASHEPDFRSSFGHVNGAWDFAGKRTTLRAGATYASSRVDANLGQPVDWIDYGLYRGATGSARIDSFEQAGLTVQHFRGRRSEWSMELGWDQVIDRATTFSVGVAHHRESGFLENPYKLVMMGFANPATPPGLFGGLLLTSVFSVAESRPDERQQWSVDMRFAHHFDRPDAALHLSWRYAQDDWGVQSHTLEARWSQAAGSRTLVTPRLRYYSQAAADFYQPYWVFRQAAPLDGSGRLVFDRIAPRYYSSDHRLSAYGAASAGLAVTHELGRHLKLEAGAEYYVHGGGLKLRGGGENGFADYHSWLVNVALRLDLGAARGVTRMAAGDDGGDDHAAHAHHHGGGATSHMPPLPAGLMYAHLMDPGGGLMVGYRYMGARQAGRIRRGDAVPGDAEMLASACGGNACELVPRRMSMHMHMLDLMVAPADGFNLMLMLQAMDMDMGMRPLEGTIVSGGGVHSHGGHDRHGSGGIGDTTLAALARLWRAGDQEVHAGFAVSVPTGAIDQTMSSGHRLDYGMQNGSGTWDVQPSLTWNGRASRWFWGAQALATVRTGSANGAGYALGDQRQFTAWGGAEVTQRVAVTARALRTLQGAIRGAYPGDAMTTSPSDYPSNYGGRYWDAGLGVSVAVPGVGARGDRLSLEWLQPVQDHPYGYQVERQGTLWFGWSAMF